MIAKYDSIGKKYNHTRRPDKKLVNNLMRHLNPNTNSVYLDIGCGTGNYTIKLHEKGIQFIGIDPSYLMLDKAKEKTDRIDWRIGTAENTGLNENQVDGIIGSLTIHHWTNLGQGFKELFRVLKPKCKIVIFTSTPMQMKGYWLNHYFPIMLNHSIIQMPSLPSVQQAMIQAGFQNILTENFSIHSEIEDKFLYCGKENPELYFDEEIRNGISSFRSLSNTKEVESGLADLRKDIDSGKIIEIINEYKNEMGDYLYITAQS